MGPRFVSGDRVFFNNVSTIRAPAFLRHEQFTLQSPAAPSPRHRDRPSPLTAVRLSPLCELLSSTTSFTPFSVLCASLITSPGFPGFVSEEGNVRAEISVRMCVFCCGDRGMLNLLWCGRDRSWIVVFLPLILGCVDYLGRVWGRLEQSWLRCGRFGIAPWVPRPRTSGVQSPTGALFLRYHSYFPFMDVGYERIKILIRLE